MNEEELTNWLDGLLASSSPSHHESVETTRKWIGRQTSQIDHLLHFLASNYTDSDRLQPVISRLLAANQKSGSLSHLALHFVPSLVGLYLLSTAKKQHRSQVLFESALLAIYHELISSDAQHRREDSVRISSLRHASVYHDADKLGGLTDMLQTTRQTLTTAHGALIAHVRRGTNKPIDRLAGSKRTVVLLRVLREVVDSWGRMDPSIASREWAQLALMVAHSGFAFPSRHVLSMSLAASTPHHSQVDYARKPRLPVTPALLVQLATGLPCCFATHVVRTEPPDAATALAVRAVHALHDRAGYEIQPELVLVVNSLLALVVELGLECTEIQPISASSTSTVNGGGRTIAPRSAVTSASLRIRRMPEDIPLTEGQQQSKQSHHAVVADGIRKKVSALKAEGAELLRKRRANTNGSSVNGDEEHELVALTEELQNGIALSDSRRASATDNNRDSVVVPPPEANGTVPQGSPFSRNGLRHADSASSTARDEP